MITCIEITDIAELDFDRLFAEMWAWDSAPENLEMKTFVAKDLSVKDIRKRLEEAQDEFEDDFDDEDENYDNNEEEEDDWEAETLKSKYALFYRKGTSTSGIELRVDTNVFCDWTTYRLRTVSPQSNKTKTAITYTILIPLTASKEDTELLNLLLRALSSICPDCRFTIFDTYSESIKEEEKIRRYEIDKQYYAIDVENDFEQRCKAMIFSITGNKWYTEGFCLYGDVAVSRRDIDFDVPTYTQKMAKIWERFRLVTWTDRKNVFVPDNEVVYNPEFHDELYARNFYNSADTLIQPCDFIAVHCDGMVKYSISSQVIEALAKLGGTPIGDDLYFIIPKMEEARLIDFYRLLKGIEVHESKRAFLLRWNPKISDFKLERLRELMKSIRKDSGSIGMRWAIRDHERVRVGDIAFLAVVGTDYNGIVMSGSVNKIPEKGTCWAGGDRVQYYVRFSPDAVIDPKSEIGPLSPKTLEKGLPDIDWDKGHSGIELTPNDGNTLIGLWNQYCSALKAEYRENSDQICFLTPDLDVFDTDSEEE
ncbi:MAG: hypothetical protein K2I18_09040 [Paramuribaculum sp.]|nr:hypothetical protein [Paramuribaculum sp.]